MSVAELNIDADLDLGGRAIKAGKVTVQSLDFGPTTGDELSGPQVKTLVGGGNADALHTHSGSGGGSGQIIKFKGITKEKMGSTSAGIGAMNEACAKAYGAARVCTTSWLLTMFPAPSVSAQSWVLGDDLFSPSTVYTATQGAVAKGARERWPKEPGSGGQRR